MTFKLTDEQQRTLDELRALDEERKKNPVKKPPSPRHDFPIGVDDDGNLFPGHSWAKGAEPSATDDVALEQPKSSPAMMYGALLGMAAGDALGTTLEFSTPAAPDYPALATGPHREII